MGQNLKGKKRADICIDICITDLICCIPETYKQLHPNKIFFK